MLVRIIIVLLLVHIIVIIPEFIRFKKMRVTIKCYLKYHVRDRIFLLFALDIIIVFLNLSWITLDWIITGNINEFIEFYQIYL